MEQPTFILAEYLFLDGAVPVQEIRSKARFIPFDFKEKVTLSSFPEWGYDGSSTNQASGSNSDLILKPVNFCRDSYRGGASFVIMCEVYNPDGSHHSTNSRFPLQELQSKLGKSFNAWIGFEQEYALFDVKTNRPHGWPEKGFPKAQGPFYCGVGGDKVYGRDLAEGHLHLCQDAGLSIFGMNAEVMPGQWEFQIGYRMGNPERGAPYYKFNPDTDSFNLLYSTDNVSNFYNPLNMADQLWMARWFLHRLSEDYNLSISFYNKPVKGDWNGSGMHTNFSTENTRNKNDGLEEIKKIMKVLEKNHKNDIKHYGPGLEKRLTGLHETCHIDEFRYGISDRGASVRISPQVEKKGFGYFEDRRPGANANPYDVAYILMKASS